MSSRVPRYSSSFLQSISKSCLNSNVHAASGTAFKCHFASSSKNTLDNLKSPSEPVLLVFDAPSQPSEHLTRRSARSPHSLSDYFSARRRLSTRQASSSTSTTALENSASSRNDGSSDTLPYSTNVHSETFDSPSKPQAYYTRPQRKADTVLELPRVQSRYVLIAVLTVLGLSAWGGFVLYATNMERVSSSIMRQLYSELRKMEPVAAVLGEGIQLEPKWWLGGEPWIEGMINTLQGKVDLRFRITGSQGSGTVYFTSIRKEKGMPFTILRFKLICDNGQILKLNDLPQ